MIKIKIQIKAKYNPISMPLSSGLHLTKCTSIINNNISTRQRLDSTHHLDIKADNMSISSVSNQKLLGLHIDENLNWNIYMDNLCKFVFSKLSLLRQLAEYVPLHVQKQFDQGHILPLLDYGSVTWGSHLPPILKDYQKYRNKQRGYYSKQTAICHLPKCYRSLTGFQLEAE